MDIGEVIERRAHSLSPQLRQAADYVAANPIEVSFRSMRYIAGKTGLTPPTFSRLARSLGFESYEQLKEACRVAAKDTYSGYRERAEALRVGHDEGRDGPKFHVAYGQQSMRNINETMVNADPLAIDRVADMALAAGRVFVNAQMGQRHMGSYAGYVASLAFDNWELLGNEPSGAASQIRRLTDNDVMICLSVMPYAKDVARQGRQLQRPEYRQTDSADSPLATLADEVLIAATATGISSPRNSARCIFLKRLSA